MLLLLTLFLFTSFNGNTAECTSNEIIDIVNDSRGSMHNFALPQNQLGLGTCASNSLSIVLGAYAGNPLSFLQIATYKTLDDKKDGTTWINGANVCNLFDNIKNEQNKIIGKQQGLCKSEDTQDLNATIKREGSFYLNKLDVFFEKLSSNGEGKKIKKRMKKALSQFDFLTDFKCQDESFWQTPIEFLLNQRLESNFKMLCASNYNAIKDVEGKIKKVEIALDPTLVTLEESVFQNFKLQKKQLESRRSYLEHIMGQMCDVQNVKNVGNKITVPLKPSLITSLSEYGKRLQRNPILAQNPSLLKIELKKFIEKNFSAPSADIIADYPMEGFAKPIFPRNSLAGTGFYNDIMKADDKDVLKAYGFETECLVEAKKRINDNFEKALLDGRCEKTKKDEEIFKLFDDLIFLSDAFSRTDNNKGKDVVEIIQDNLDDLLDFNQDKVQYVRDLMSSNCNDDFKIPKKITCEDQLIFAGPDKKIEEECIEKLGEDKARSVLFLANCMKEKMPDFENYSSNKRKDKLKNIISKNLKTSINEKIGVPTILSICASFLGGGEDSHTYSKDYQKLGLVSADYNCKRKTVRDGKMEMKHAEHAVTVIGMRCVAGETQYLIQNSWGQTCGPYMKDGKELFECDESRGAIWVGENKLINNVTNAYTVGSK